MPSLAPCFEYSQPYSYVIFSNIGEQGLRTVLRALDPPLPPSPFHLLTKVTQVQIPASMPYVTNMMKQREFEFVVDSLLCSDRFFSSLFKNQHFQISIRSVNCYLQNFSYLVTYLYTKELFYYIILHYITLYYVMLCYVMLCYIIFGFIVPLFSFLLYNL